MAKKSKFYTDEPVVPSSKRADKPPIQNASLGNDVPNIVPSNPGQRLSTNAPHGYGHKKVNHKGYHRMSGNIKAHRLGS